QRVTGMDRARHRAVDWKFEPHRTFAQPEQSLHLRSQPHVIPVVDHAVGIIGMADPFAIHRKAEPPGFLFLAVVSKKSAVAADIEGACRVFREAPGADFLRMVGEWGPREYTAEHRLRGGPPEQPVVATHPQGTRAIGKDHAWR